MEQEIVTLQEIGCYVQKGVSREGKSVGEFIIHDVKPKFLERAKEFGISFTEIASEFEKNNGAWKQNK